ncbi:penicillin acylase family protein, partial [Thermodesulfobacteriota bacterium]
MNADRVAKLFAMTALSALLSITACDNDGDGGGGQAVPTIFDQVEVTRTLSFPQLEGRVEVIKDEFGVPHIVSVDDNPSDIVFVQGYVTAADRFWEMDLIRKFAGGKITELMGLLDPSILTDDLYYRTIFTTVRGNRLHQEIVDLLRDEAPEAFEVLVRYTDGINAFLADLRAGRNGATLPTEYRVLLLSADRISDWGISDSLTLGAYQQWSLSSSLGSELGRQLRWESLADAEDGALIPTGTLADTLQRSAPIEDVYIVPGFYDGRKGGERGPAKSSGYRRLPADFDVDLLRQMVDTYKRIDRHSASFQPDIGSNNWVIG